MERYTSGAIAAIVFILTMVGFLALGLAGCTTTHKYTGTWEGMDYVPAGTDENSPTAMTYFRVTMTIDKLGNFKLQRTGMPLEGVLDTHGDTATLRVTKLLGSKVDNVLPTKQDDPTLQVLGNDELLYKDHMTRMEGIKLKRKVQPQSNSSSNN